LESFPYIVGICRNTYITAGDPPLCNQEDFKKELRRLRKQLDDLKKRQEKYAKRHHR
jgi:hypothetical protein